AAHKIRVRHQPQDRESAWPDHSAIGARAGRPGHRITRARPNAAIWASARLRPPTLTEVSHGADWARGHSGLMDRRVFVVSFVLGSLAMPRTALTQPARNVHRIGILSSRSTTSEMVGAHPQDPLVNALLRGLRELGYVYGEHFMTEPRGGE